MALGKRGKLWEFFPLTCGRPDNVYASDNFAETTQTCRQTVLSWIDVFLWCVISEFLFKLLMLRDSLQYVFYFITFDHTAATTAAFFGTTVNVWKLVGKNQTRTETRGPTTTPPWLLTVRRSDTWWTVVLKKAAAVSEKSTRTIK